MKTTGIIISLLALLVSCALLSGCTSTNPPVTPVPTPTITTGGVQSSDWTMVNYDPTYSRNSPQTVIGKNNVNQLQVKWILNTGYAVENPPLIIGNTVYAQNNALQVIAIDLVTGLSKWKFDPGVPASSGLLPRASSSHGMVYENGIIYAPTGPNGTVVALNAQNGAKIWETEKIDIGPAWRISAPPVIWKNIIIAGSALGDEPPFGIAQKGTVTGDRQRPRVKNSGRPSSPSGHG